MSYNPRAHGARCDLCPLANCATPVPPSPATKTPKLVVLGESPGRNEETEGKPFIGASGRELNHALKYWRVSRDEVHITNAVLCRPPNDLRPTQWEQALEACRPRLGSELAESTTERGFPPVLALGAKALQTLTDKAKINPWVGAVLPSQFGPVVPSIHPAAALRKPALLPVLKLFVGRAVQLAEGRLPAWVWPEIHITPGAEMYAALEQILAAQKPVGVDVETAGLDPMRDDLLCIGLANEDVAVSVPWPTTPEYQSVIEQILGHANITKVLHNAQHDLLSLNYNGLEVRGEIFDTLLAHAVVAPQLPHDLGFVAACEFPAPRWKTEFRVEGDSKGQASFAKRPAHELRTYNAKDAYMTALLHGALRERIATTHNGPALFSELTALADLAMRMREYGLKVDRGRFDEHRSALLTAMEDAKTRFHAIVGAHAELGKAGSSKTLHKLFFDDFGIKPLHYTEHGEPQLDREMLEHIQTTGHPQAVPVATATLEFRKAAKIISTYIDGLSLDPNDFLHPVWKVYGTISGRWSSADPNAQNWPLKMRDLVIPRRLGNYIVGADFSQLELRIIALLAGDEKLLSWYAEDQDVHTLTAWMLFNTEKPSKIERDVAKQVEYGFNYNLSSDVTAVWKQTLIRIPKLIGQLSISRMERFRKLWFKGHPWIREWQLATVRQAAKDQYIEAPLSGRRRHFHDGLVDPNEVLNFPMQATAGDLTNRAILAIDKQLDWAAGERIVAQVHDAIYLEGPDPFRLFNILKLNMEQTVTLSGRTMTFPVDIGIATNWKDASSLKVSKVPECSFPEFMSALSFSPS